MQKLITLSMNKGLISSMLDYFWVLSGTFVSRGVAMLNTIIIARILGLADFGIFTIFYSVAIMTWQLPLAFDAVFVARAKRTENKKEKLELLKASLGYKVAYLLSIIFISYPLAFILEDYVFKKNNLSIVLLKALISGGFLTFLMSFASIYQEEEKYIKYSLTHAVYTVTILIFLLFFLCVSIPINLESITTIYLLVSIILGLSSIIALSIKAGNIFVINRSKIDTIFRYGKWMIGCSIVFHFFIRIDIIYLTRYVDFDMVGLYASAAQLNMIVAVATGALAGTCLPKSGNAIKSKANMIKYIKESGFTILLIELFIIFYFLFAHVAINVLYGSEYSAASNILRILLLGSFINAIYTPFSFILLAYGKTKILFLIELSKLITAITLLNFMINKFQMIGAAFTITIAIAVQTIFAFYIFRTSIGEVLEFFFIKKIPFEKKA